VRAPGDVGALADSRLRGFVAAEANEVPGVVEQAASEIVRGADGGERCIGGLVAVAVSEAGTGHGAFGQSVAAKCLGAVIDHGEQLRTVTM
jgi:hypothetical protein